jgi:hypothetical protein
MDEQDRVLAGNIEQLMSRGGRGARRGRALAADRTLQVLVADLIAARAAAGMTQQEVADRMPSTKSVGSRLDRVWTRPSPTSNVERQRVV